MNFKKEIRDMKAKAIAGGNNPNQIVIPISKVAQILSETNTKILGLEVKIVSDNMMPEDTTLFIMDKNQYSL